MTNALDTITSAEYEAIRTACEKLPRPKGNYHRDDYVLNLLLTVLDYQNKRPTIEKALAHFRAHHGEALNDHASLRRFLDTFADDRKAATVLWGNNHWRRVRELRGLLAYFESLPEPAVDHASLRKWAEESTFEQDFKGRVKGLGLAIYKWLTMRLGVNTIKPDVHVHNFLKKSAGRTLSDREAVAVLEAVAKEIDRLAYELDWSIWERATGQDFPLH